MESYNNIDFDLSEFCERKMTYFCISCNLNFKNTLEQSNHMKTVHCSNVFKCSFCVNNLQIFDNMESLRQHFFNFHGLVNKTSYTCRLCNYSSERYHEFLLHVNHEHSTHNPRQVYNDNIPHLYNSPQSSRNLNQAQKLTSQVFESCKSTNKIHSICDFYYCFINKKKFISEDSDDLRCNFCNIKFENWAIFTCHLEDELHINAKKEYSCIECKKTLTSEIEIQKHVREHLISNLKKICNLCNASFYTPLQLEYHLLRKHEVPDGNLKCDLCGKFFEDVEQFYVHMLEQSFDSKSLNCKLCQINFSFEQQLLNHSTTHSIIKYKQLKDRSSVKFIQISF